jgi:hypothetical protein
VRGSGCGRLRAGGQRVRLAPLSWAATAGAALEEAPLDPPPPPPPPRLLPRYLDDGAYLAVKAVIELVGGGSGDGAGG